MSHLRSFSAEAARNAPPPTTQMQTTSNVGPQIIQVPVEWSGESAQEPAQSGQIMKSKRMGKTYKKTRAMSVIRNGGNAGFMAR